MKQKGITYKLTPYSLWAGRGFAMMLAGVCVLPFALGGIFRVFGVVVMVPLMLWCVGSVLYRLLVGVQVKRRQERFDAYLATRQSTLAASTSEGLTPPFALASINQLGSPTDKDVRNRRYYNNVRGPGWEYADYAYDIYGKAADDASAFSTHYYSVFSMTLPRVVPNVLFDSRRSRGRQFRTMFAADQIHDLEGDFSKFFSMYVPYGYTIDAYSFISPEVMWAMREAADYDIEIAGNKLYLMGAMGEPSFVVDDMHAKASAIYKALADNLETYRDERLPLAQGRQSVASLGARLYESHVKLAVEYLTATLVITGLIAGLFANSVRGLVIVAAIVVPVTTYIYGRKLYGNQKKRQQLKQKGNHVIVRPSLHRASTDLPEAGKQ